MKINKISSSYRDPSGFVFVYENEIFRQVNDNYRENYESLMISGLYQRLVDIGALIRHEEVELQTEEPGGYKVIKPEAIPFISYPYEWCFSQLKDAALLTLQIQKEALKFSMSLKDASSFNIQFLAGRPIFIDTLSFEKYKEGEPWVAYKQFCEHFFAPLALMACVDSRLGNFLQTNIDGVPLDIAGKILPLSAKIRPAVFLHIILHSRNQKQYSDSSIEKEKKNKFSKNAFLGILDNLENGIMGLKLKKIKTAWSDYCDDDNCESYESESLQAKKNLVADYLDKARAKNLWDIGANNGLYSRIAAKKGISVISMDFDEAVVEQNYLRVKAVQEKKILPLVSDIANPTPAIGWHNRERLSILSRPLPDAVLALALIHHLAISKNVPFEKIARLFSEIAPALIIEFVPKDDRQTKRLLNSREDIFTRYNIEEFEREFGNFFRIREKKHIPDSKRFIYLMDRK
jgi:hypothetical protein